MLTPYALVGNALLASLAMRSEGKTEVPLRYPSKSSDVNNAGRLAG
jgi:hypothetical protein